MTPAKRRPATPASEGPTRTAPDVPTAPADAPAADEPPETKASGRKAAARDGGGNSARPSETGRADAEDRAATQSPQRPRGRYPLPVWPD